MGRNLKTHLRFLTLSTNIVMLLGLHMVVNPSFICIGRSITGLVIFRLVVVGSVAPVNEPKTHQHSKQ